MKKLFLNFYNVFAVIESDWDDLLEVISKDFYCFLSEERSLGNNWKFQIKVENSLPPDGFIPEIQATMQTNNSISYDLLGARYSDYYGKLYSKLVFDENYAEIYSKNFDRAHEVIYLMILSRIGKKLDLLGMHKLHAFAISYKNNAVVCMMPMKGGKSTLLLELLKYDGIKLISDDIPMFDTFANLKPFPLKIGLEKDCKIEIEVKDAAENIYSMNRELYGDKKLICLKGLQTRVEGFESKYEKIFLIESFRNNSQFSTLNRASFFLIIKGLFKHGIIGFGLPIVYEFFWEFGWKDFLRKTYIFLRRLSTFSILAIKSEKYKLMLGKKPEKAAKLIVDLLN